MNNTTYKLQGYLMNNIITGYDLDMKDIDNSKLDSLITFCLSLKEGEQVQKVNTSKIRAIFKQVVYLVECEDLDWDEKYDMIFSEAVSGKLYNLLKEGDVCFTWCDPDCDYEDDVRAYYNALKETIDAL